MNKKYVLEAMLTNFGKHIYIKRITFNNNKIKKKRSRRLLKRLSLEVLFNIAGDKIVQNLPRCFSIQIYH